MSSQSELFQPITVGTVKLQHRVALAPLTRFKATEKTHVPHAALVKEYYAQRGSTPGTLLISEATFISPQAGGYDHVPGIWSEEQIAAWKEITDAVHSKGSFIYLQLWNLGRAAKPETLRAETPPLPFVAPSPIKLDGTDEVPRELTTDEIKAFLSDYAKAAANAVHKAGFDGVEIHGANGYLIDQFLQDVSNHRTDDYGGSIENRTRFALEIVDTIVKEIGAERTGFRVSPWNGMQGMRMENPKPTFEYLATQIKQRYPNFAYLHVVEPRADGYDVLETVPAAWENDFLRKIWAPSPFISAGGYEPSTAKAVADTKGDIVAFGRKFIANPDLPLRLKNDIPLNKSNRDTYYLPGAVPKGYTDYPFADELNKSA